MAPLGRPSLQLDVMTSGAGPTFPEAWEERLVAEFGDQEVAFLGREGLLENERAAGRPRDLADIALLAEGSD